MKTAEFIKTISQKSGFSQKDVKEVVDATFETIVDVIGNDDSLSIQGFGKFFANHIEGGAERVNSLTGEKYVVKAHNQPKFKFSPKVKEVINA